jgi:copper transport protein
VTTVSIPTPCRGPTPAGDSRPRKLLGRLSVVGGVIAGLLLLFTPSASAHAELLETNPANGAHFDRAPTEVMLRFSETVSPVRGGFSVLDGNGKTIATPTASTGDGGRVTMPLPGSLGDGVYVINWRVVSADSHPVHGAFVFSIGTARAAPLGEAGAQSGSDSGVGVAFWLFRLLGYASLAMVIGGSFFVIACWPAGRGNRRAHRILKGAWVAALITTVGSAALQGPYATGGSLAGVVDPQLLLDTLQTSYGVLLIARLVLLGLAGVVLTGLINSLEPVSRKQIIIVAGVGVLLAGTWSGTGHPAAAGGWSWAALPLDAAHLAGVSIWLGGLAILVACTLGRASRTEDAEAADAVTRYSRAAAVAIVVLGGTGLLQAARELLDTGMGSTYFSLLVFKIGAFGLLIWLAALSRSAVRRQLVAPAGGRKGAARQARQDMLTRLRVSVRWEVGIAVVVLGLTAALVATPPGGHDHGPGEIVAAQGGPFLHAVSLPGSGDVQVWVDPAKPGNNQIVLNVRDGKGFNRDVPEVAAELRMPAGNIGPLPVTLTKAGPGQFVANGVVVPVAGTWQLSVKVRSTDFDQTTVDAQIVMQ